VRCLISLHMVDARPLPAKPHTSVGLTMATGMEVLWNSATICSVKCLPMV
jgi:hypothetical protein